MPALSRKGTQERSITRLLSPASMYSFKRLRSPGAFITSIRSRGETVTIWNVDLLS